MTPALKVGNVALVKRPDELCIDINPHASGCKNMYPLAISEVNPSSMRSELSDKSAPVGHTATGLPVVMAQDIHNDLSGYQNPGYGTPVEIEYNE